MRDIVSPLDGLSSPLGPRRGFNPISSLFANNEPGFFFDPSDAANLDWRYNFATGSAAVGDVTYWPASSVQNGITGTKVASGTDTDGLPYVDVRYQGTATATFQAATYSFANSIIPASAGQTYTASVIARVIAGSAANNSLITAVVELTSANGYIIETSSAQVVTASDTLLSATRTLNQSTVANARTAVTLLFSSGAVIDVTYRIKGLQLERGSVRTAYQPITDLHTEVRARFPNATLFQDTAGTQPVTTVGQSVARVNDKSGRGNHATQATAASRPLFAQVPSVGVRNFANGSADVGNGFYWAAVSSFNGVTVTKVGTGVDTAGLPYVDYSVSGTASATGLVALGYSTVLSRVAAATGQTFTNSALVQIISGTPPSGASGVQLDIAGEVAPATYSEGSTSAIFQSTTESVLSVTRTLSGGTTNQARGGSSVSYVSGVTYNYTIRIKALQFERGSARTAYQFNYAAWNITEPNTLPVNGLYYDGVDDFLVTPVINPEAGVVATGPELVANGAFGSGTTGWSSNNGATISAPSGELLVTSSGLTYGGAVASISTVVGGTYSVTFTARRGTADLGWLLVGSSFGSSSIATLPFTSTGNTTITSSFVATSTTTFLTVQANNTVSNGTVFADNISVREATGAADKAQVFAGVRKLSDAAVGTVVELTAAGDVNNGGFFLRAPTTPSTNSYQGASRGTVAGFVQTTGFAAPITNVVTFRAEIATDTAILRVNGSQAASSPDDQGTGNYASAAIFIGRRNGASLPFNGIMFPITARFGPSLTADTIAANERWFTGKTPA